MKRLIFILLILFVAITNYSQQKKYHYNFNDGGRTDLYLQKGDKVSIKASGKVKLGAFAGWGGPKGITGFEIYSIIRITLMEV